MIALILAIRQSSASEPIIQKLYSVAVVIAARNEEENLPHLIESVMAQDYPKFDVYIVDDRSEDRTGEIVAKYCQSYPNLHWVRITETPVGYSPKKYALQTAIEQIEHDLIVTTDADCIVPKSWLSRMVAEFADEQVGFVFGLIHYEPAANNFLGKWQSFDFFALICTAAATVRGGFPFACAGPSLAYRRKLFSAVGGFATVKHRLSGDDVLLMQLIRRVSNVRIKFMGQPDARVLTQTESTWRNFWWQRLRWASNSDIQWQLNKTFLFFLIFMFLANVLVILGLFYSFFWPGIIDVWLPYIVSKFILEYIFLRIGAKQFNEINQMKFFPQWFLTYPFYVIIIAIGTKLLRIRWK